MSNLLSLLGVDEEEFSWMNLALCRGMDTGLFFDKYESDVGVANMIDQACLSCPVMRQCMEYAVDNNEYGCWAGIYMNGGKPDKNRNLHKTQETWDEIRRRIE